MLAVLALEPRGSVVLVLEPRGIVVPTLDPAAIGTLPSGLVSPPVGIELTRASREEVVVLRREAAPAVVVPMRPRGVGSAAAVDMSRVINSFVWNNNWNCDAADCVECFAREK